MAQTPYRLFINGKDMLHVLFQLRLAPIFAKIGAILSKTLGKMLVESAVAPNRNEKECEGQLQPKPGGVLGFHVNQRTHRLVHVGLIEKRVLDLLIRRWWFPHFCDACFCLVHDGKADCELTQEQEETGGACSKAEKMAYGRKRS